MYDREEVLVGLPQKMPHETRQKKQKHKQNQGNRSSVPEDYGGGYN